MRTITYNGDSSAVVMGGVATFERGVPVEFPDELAPDASGLTDGELLELGLSLDPEVWSVVPPFPIDEPAAVDAEPAGEPATEPAADDAAKPAKPARKRP